VRRFLGLAAAGALAATAATASITTSTAAGQQARSDSITSSAIHALESHGAVARSTRGTAFVARSVIVDRSGATHVRVDRTFRGLPVLGGDLVIHRGANGGWAGVSQSLRVPLTLGTRPTVSGAAAQATSLRGIANRTVSRARVEGATRLVVDARGAAPRLAWEVVTGGVQRDGTPPAALRRTSTHAAAQCFAPSSRSRPSTAPASRSTAGPCRCS
jgi:hypothetical protein